MKQLDVTALKDFLANHSGEQQPVLLDVREPWETALGQIELSGARSLTIPMNDIAARRDELDPEQVIVCICHHGVRSAQVTAFLERQGFQSVWNLAGGTDAWSAQVDPQLGRY